MMYKLIMIKLTHGIHARKELHRCSIYRKKKKVLTRKKKLPSEEFYQKTYEIPQGNHSNGNLLEMGKFSERGKNQERNTEFGESAYIHTYTHTHVYIQYIK